MNLPTGLNDIPQLPPFVPMTENNPYYLDTFNQPVFPYPPPPAHAAVLQSLSILRAGNQTPQFNPVPTPLAPTFGVSPQQSYPLQPRYNSLTYCLTIAPGNTITQQVRRRISLKENSIHRLDGIGRDRWIHRRRQQHAID
jgi:hypothetical protein